MVLKYERVRSRKYVPSPSFSLPFLSFISLLLSFSPFHLSFSPTLPPHTFRHSHYHNCYGDDEKSKQIHQLLSFELRLLLPIQSNGPKKSESEEGEDSCSETYLPDLSCKRERESGERERRGEGGRRGGEGKGRRKEREREKIRVSNECLIYDKAGWKQNKRKDSKEDEKRTKWADIPAMILSFS